MGLSGVILRILGWKLVGKIPDEKKMLAVSVPHTSMWDFVIGRLFLYQLKIKPLFLVKKELFFFPLGFFMKRMGGIPINRSKKSDTIERLIQLFNDSDTMLLTITPEGTRKNVVEWKTGFHYIAKGANVPILPTYLDYQKKVIGIGDLFFAGETAENDVNHIKEFVKDVIPKHPELFNHL
jgi:1-acyl-sn-glycerol-3-phosphate acyltransferase